MLGAVKSAGTYVHTGIVNAIKNLPSTLQNLGKSAIYNLGDMIKGSASYAKTGALKVASAIESAILQVPSKMLSVGKNIVSGLWNGISGMTGWLAGKIRDFASSIVKNIKGALGIHSPSTVFRDQIGKNMALGMGEGFEKNVPVDAMEDSISGSVNKLKRASYSVTAKAPVTTTSVLNKTEVIYGDEPKTDDDSKQREIIIHTHVDLDGKEVGNSVTKYVDRNMSDDEELRRRGN